MKTLLSGFRLVGLCIVAESVSLWAQPVVVVVPEVQGPMMAPPTIFSNLPQIQGTENPNALTALQVGQQLRLGQQQQQLQQQQIRRLKLENRRLEMENDERQRNVASAEVLAGTAGSIQTWGALNCRGFSTLTSDSQMVYVVGLYDGYVVGVQDGQVSVGSPLRGEAMVAQIAGEFGHAVMTYGERASSLMSVCAAPENAVLPVSFAVQIVTARASGKTYDEVERYSAALRSAAATAK